LLGFFWRDWLRIVSGVLRSLKQREVKHDDAYTKLGWLFVVSTIPAGILGLLFEERLKQVFAAATVVAVGAVLYAVALLRARDAGKARTMTGRLPVCRGRKPLPLA
jgi:undecaprenyl-diphosphatase